MAVNVLILIFFHCNSGCTNVPQCYFIHTFHVFSYLFIRKDILVMIFLFVTVSCAFLISFVCISHWILIKFVIIVIPLNLLMF